MKSLACIAALILGLSGLVSCSTPAFLRDMLPPVYAYSSRLVPSGIADEEDGYTVNPDGSITFDQDGLRVTVRHLSDVALNELYPDVSFQGRFSANPFTYGNWRDPGLGYTPTRFTVFEVEVFNPVLPKAELFPDQTILRTSQGEEVRYYSINREQSDNSFEDYFTLIRGPGGNEQYRFDQRMSIVREELYRPDHQIFRGDDYRGYLVFQALNDEVTGVQLQINGFALQFDEANHATKTTDLLYHLDRKVDKRLLEGDDAQRARRRDWLLPLTAGS